ncbi:hypothetical protein PsorP6_000813 [Peronosclerospora sorghi]|uniref:Uncharacterized protein n=1 Tax=Peronosclerospora sorghi TaxID=230839 RepID=A0ACC0WRE0_9STRA|nr:hypothetical protein PsorP6_000813 [Peronosclerospora sorghi]
MELPTDKAYPLQGPSSTKFILHATEAATIETVALSLFVAAKEPTTFGLCMFVMQSTIMAPHRIGRPIRLFENSTKMRGTG